MLSEFLNVRNAAQHQWKKNDKGLNNVIILKDGDIQNVSKVGLKYMLHSYMYHWKINFENAKRDLKGEKKRFLLQKYTKFIKSLVALLMIGTYILLCVHFFACDQYAAWW